MVRAAYILAALSFLTAGLLLWKAYGPAVFFDLLLLNMIC